MKKYLIIGGAAYAAAVLYVSYKNREAIAIQGGSVIGGFFNLLTHPVLVYNDLTGNADG